MKRGRRTKRLPTVIADSAPVIPITDAITDAEWARLEEAYECKLSLVVRMQISMATQTFIANAKVEYRVEPAAGALNRIELIKKAANALHRELHDGRTEADGYARHLIKEEFAKERPREVRSFDAGIDDIDDPNFSAKIFKAVMRENSDPPDEMEIISKQAHSLAAMCLRALVTLSVTPGFQIKTEWETWVRNITSIVKRNGLQSGAPHDDEAAKKAPFVKFMKKLEELCVPDKYQCGKQGEGAMAQAITRARNAIKGPRRKSR